VWRLERLRGFGAAVGGLLTCQCMRIGIGGEPAVLIVAGERVGPGLSFEARLRRLVNGSANPAAVFSTKGKLLDASSDAIALLGARNQLEHIGAAALAQQASESGHAEGKTSIGPVALDQLNAGDSSVLLMTLRPRAVAQTQTESKAAAPAIIETTGEPTKQIEATSERPLRFVWHMDRERRFTIQSDSAVSLLGPRVGALFGKPWGDIASELDPQGVVAPLLDRQDTWTGVVLRWPIDDGTAGVELSGLPLFGPDREVEGYRGFGICRDVARLRDLAALREKSVEPAAPPVTPDAPAEERTATVVPFPAPERPPALARGPAAGAAVPSASRLRP
jgi:PAS domain-containing protein